MNLLVIKIDKMTSLLLNIKQRIENYKSLKYIIENLNRHLDRYSVVDDLLDFIFNLIAHQRGNCLLYLVDTLKQKLYLFATRREDERTLVKAKEGDIFDLWVIRHTNSLLVEDARSDFRFDFGAIEKSSQRAIGSLISSPLLSQDKLLGIIRIDNPLTNVYNQEDLRLLGVIADFAAVAIENTKLLEEAKELAIKDSLTGCFTKNYLIERLTDEFLRNIKESKYLSILMVDIDHFKLYNDKFGHIAGDLVLKEIGQLLNKIVKDRGMVFRFGGEEFCILLPHTDKKNALFIAQNIVESVRQKIIFLRRYKTSVTVSIGLACAPEDAILEDELIFKADYRLYQAKQKGRDRVCYV
ncbi:MAG: sensor domain-containing diguanylate cyclase [Candidatus Omnitrophica bacterium]|nr:sensor domain-containing diguanylate cyclase [Candidatus Omnitrophota bacterium]